MTAPIVRSRLMPFVRCREPGCQWQPNPDRRMSPDSQAQEHTNKAGHTTESGLERKGDEDADR